MDHGHRAQCKARTHAASRRLGDGDGTFSPKRAYTAGDDPDGVGLADLNRDGRLDLIATHNVDANVSTFLGNGDGTFANPVEYSIADTPDAVAVADFNGDGTPDIATSSLDSAPAIAAGHGNGVFDAPQSLLWSSFEGAAVADFNHDGRPDLAFADAAWHYANVFVNSTGSAAQPCVVPYLQGYAIAPAKRAVTDVRLSAVCHRYTRTAEANRVIAQHPRGGTVLPSPSRVDLLVSRGRRPRTR